MARIITKELALKIVQKLGAKRPAGRRPGGAHDIYVFEYEGVLVAELSIRRSSEKDKGHDYLAKELYLGPGQARRLGQCPLSLAEYVDILRQKGVLGQAPAGDGQSPPAEQPGAAGPASGEPPT